MYASWLNLPTPPSLRDTPSILEGEQVTARHRKKVGNNGRGEKEDLGLCETKVYSRNTIHIMKKKAYSKPQSVVYEMMAPQLLSASDYKEIPVSNDEIIYFD